MSRQALSVRESYRIERGIAQDCYRLCFKNQLVDDMSDNDEQDLTHIIAVASHALAVGATRRVNSGSIEVPTLQGVAKESEDQS